MNTQEMMRILDSIARDRKIDKAMLVKDLEQAMVSAARKHFNTLDTEEFTCTIDPMTGAAARSSGTASRWRWRPQDLGRIAAQTVKQVMIQLIRQDERGSIYEEYKDRVGTIVTGTIARFEGGTMIVNLGRVEGDHAAQRADPRRAAPAGRARAGADPGSARHAGSR